MMLATARFGFRLPGSPNGALACCFLRVNDGSMAGACYALHGFRFTVM